MFASNRSTRARWLLPPSSKSKGKMVSGSFGAWPAAGLGLLNLDSPARRSGPSSSRRPPKLASCPVGMFCDIAPAIDVGTIDDCAYFIHHRDGNHRLSITMHGTDFLWLKVTEKDCQQ